MYKKKYFSDCGDKRANVISVRPEVDVRNLEQHRRRVEVRPQPHALGHVQKVVLKPFTFI
jgi:hypothetical protein